MGVREHYIVMLTIIHPPLPGDHLMLTDTWGRGPDGTMMGPCGVWRSSDDQSFVFQPWGINLVHCARVTQRSVSHCPALAVRLTLPI